MALSKSNVAITFFDVDRTVVTANTANLYLRWRYQRGEIGLRGVLVAASWLAQYAVGTLNADAIAERGVADVAGKTGVQFRSEIETFYNECVRDVISQDAQLELRRVAVQGSELVLLSAGLEDSVRLLAEDLRDEKMGEVHTIATRLEEKKGILTGRCERLCYGEHKVGLARDFAEARGVSLDDCAFYSDSISDAPLLEAVGKPIVINPDFRLRRLAKKRRWPVRRWS